MADASYVRGVFMRHQDDAATTPKSAILLLFFAPPNNTPDTEHGEANMSNTPNHLFQPKLLARHINPNATIPAAHLEQLHNWQSHIEQGAIAKQKEEALQGVFIERILSGILGYQSFGGKGPHYTVAKEYWLGRGKADAVLGHLHHDKQHDQIIAVCELKSAKTHNLDAIMSGRGKTPIQQGWEYAHDAKGCQWVIVSNYLELRLYAVGETTHVYEHFALNRLTDPAEYTRFILCLAADQLLTGRTRERLTQSQQIDQDITAQLYRDYKNLRERLLTHLIHDNPGHAPASLLAPAQKLLDRVLFIAFAEDHGLIPDNSIHNAYTHANPYDPQPIYQNFKGLFRAIDQGSHPLNIPAYNGGLFADDPQLNHLIISDSLCEGFKVHVTDKHAAAY